MKFWIILMVAAVAVITAAVIALREPPAPPSQPAPVVVTPKVVVAPEVEPVVVEQATPEPEPVEPSPAPLGAEIMDDQALLAALGEFGFDNLEVKWREWARKRGYPITDASGQRYYEQPYEQYDNETLQGLAGNGDMWAAQILAGRIAKENPAEAIELYRLAAAQGSVYAMNEMAGLYSRIANQRRDVEFKSPDVALDQVYAMRDGPVDAVVSGYAWSVVATMAGSEPMFGDINAGQLEERMTETQIEEACSLAEGLFDELRSRRSAQGLGPYDRSPPPMVYADASRKPRCGHDFSAGMDLTGCREMVVESQGEQSKVWLCDE